MSGEMETRGPISKLIWGVTISRIIWKNNGQFDQGTQPLKPRRQSWNKISGRARRVKARQSKLSIGMREGVIGDRPRFDMVSTRAFIANAPHMLKAGVVVSLAMNAWDVGWQGGRGRNKEGWRRQEWYSMCQASEFCSGK